MIGAISRVLHWRHRIKVNPKWKILRKGPVLATAQPRSVERPGRSKDRGEVARVRGPQGSPVRGREAELGIVQWRQRGMKQWAVWTTNEHL